MDIQYLQVVMSTSAVQLDPETLHPSLWRASQLARANTLCIDTGHAPLSNLLPGGGWPVGTLIDLLVQQPGIGEIRLLGPALAKVASRKVFIVTPPQIPQSLAWCKFGIEPSQMMWIRSERTGDALWSVETLLRSGCCGAVLFWQNHMRADSLRRLHLAAQSGETLFIMFRPLASTMDASPAPLRLSLRPAQGGLDIGFVKRRGPQYDGKLFLPMPVIQAPRSVPQRVIEREGDRPRLVPSAQEMETIY
jgi:protein ImuA